VKKAAELRPALEQAMAHHEGPYIVEIISSADQL
jgi:hypothetical protein